MSDGAWHQFRLTGDRLLAVRMVELDGRFVVSELILIGDMQLTTEDLRDIKLGRYEAMANAGGGHLERFRIMNNQANGVDDPSLRELRHTRELAKALAPEPAPSKRQRLTRPDRSDPNGFYRSVAEAYKEYAQETRAAALRVAEEADVPAATAHRWINEARRRGHLPPGRAGKTG
jgi:hypothetical protein